MMAKPTHPAYTTLKRVKEDVNSLGQQQLYCVHHPNESKGRCLFSGAEGAASSHLYDMGFTKPYEMEDVNSLGQQQLYCVHNRNESKGRC